jgi:hypothetical protein
VCGFKHGLGAQKLLRERTILCPRAESGGGAAVRFYQKAADFPSAGLARLIVSSQFERIILAAVRSRHSAIDFPAIISVMLDFAARRRNAIQRRLRSDILGSTKTA